MAWNKELTKEDLIKAGLNPDDLAEMKANGVKKADLDAMKTEMATSMTELIKNQFAELEGKLKPVKQENQDQNNNQNNQNNQVDEQADFMADPAAYVNKKMSQAVGFTAVQATKIRMDLALDRAKASLQGFKNDSLKSEIMEEWNQYKPESFAMNKDFDPDKLITKIHNMVLGNHMEEIQRDTNKREGKFNLVASTLSGGGGGNVNLGGHGEGKKPEELLTPIQLKQAARYNMTAQEWLDQEKAMADEENKVMSQA